MSFPMELCQRMPVTTAVELNALPVVGCADCRELGSAERHHLHERPWLYVQPICHPTSHLNAAYMFGDLFLICSTCESPVHRLKVL